MALKFRHSKLLIHYDEDIKHSFNRWIELIITN